MMGGHTILVLEHMTMTDRWHNQVRFIMIDYYVANGIDVYAVSSFSYTIVLFILQWNTTITNTK